MAIKLSVSHADDVVTRLLRERLIDTQFGEGREGMPSRPMVFGVVHHEGEADIYLFLRFAGHKNSADNGLSAYRIQGNSREDAVEEATKIYLSIKDDMGYHKSLRPSPLRPTSSWYPHLSQYEWDLLEDRGEVAGLSSAHWYEVFLSLNDALSLERLSQFYKRPSSETERLIEIVTDSRIIDYFASNPDDLLKATPRQFEELIAELLGRLGYTAIDLSPEGRDGGVDITAYIEHPFGIERVIVQCKRYTPPRKIGEPIIKQLLTDVDIQRAARGLIVTTSMLTAPARLLVESFRHRLSHIEGNELRERLTSLRAKAHNTAMHRTETLARSCR
jgi:hypothetical protein